MAARGRGPSSGSAPSAEHPYGLGAWLVLAAILPGLFMNVFDFFAVNVATPALHSDLDSGPPPWN